MQLHKYVFFWLLLGCLLAAGCRKYLEVKSDNKLVTPTSLQDLQAIMDHATVMNTGPALALTASDDYYLTDDTWNGLTAQADKDSYTWSDNPNLSTDWNNGYKVVLIANTVLDHLEEIPGGEDPALWNEVKGAALFFRSFTFYGLAQVYAPPYNGASASSDYGIPLRLNSDYSEKSVRATLQQTYDQMTGDLELAARLLPATSRNVLRPSRPAALALLARIYLVMGDYEKGRAAADSCLKYFSTLLDYNTLNAGAAIPVGAYNAEVIFHSIANSSAAATGSRANMDTVLYASYATDDLRRKVFFSGSKPYKFKGNYYSTLSRLFNGIAANEVYLVRAECRARTGQTAGALDDLNTLMKKRWKQGSFVPLAAATADEALLLILQERRKELVMRDTRWMDLRRLNREPRFATTIKRVLNGQEYVLPPGDPRYAFLIPERVIELTGMPQNKR